MSDHTELRDAAAAATPGPWVVRDARFDNEAAVGQFDGTYFFSESADPKEYDTEKDGAYICAVSPDRVLALLDERDALAARLDRIEHAAREVLAWEPEPGDAEWLDLTTLDRWGKDIAALRGALGDDDDG